MTCLDAKDRFVIQCQNIVDVLNECEIVELKLRNLEMLTNAHAKNETQSDMIGELIQVETDEIMLNENISQQVTSEKINQMIAKIEPSHGSLRKVECTHCKIKCVCK